MLLPLTPAQRVHAARHDLRRRQPRDGNARRLIDLSVSPRRVAVRTPDVAAADRDERDDPAQREGPRDGRLHRSERGRHDRKPERRSLRSDFEHVHVRRRERVSTSVPLGLAAAARRDGAPRRRQPHARDRTKRTWRSTRRLTCSTPTAPTRCAPTITSVTPGAFRYGVTFHVHTSDAADIRSVVLVRPGASTHAFDMDQRLVELALHGRSGRVDRHVAAQRQHRAARLLHAVHPQLGRRAVGSQVRAAVGHDSQSASNRPYCEPVRERHGERG